ncbi:MAG: hypothetical protein J6D19_07030 [Clostridia bacterium]|nr:hypothetical protein [Clostridia bacterium]
MKLLIVGSRSIENFDLTNYIPPETDLIISGGAKGIDEIAENFADQHKISKLIIYPRYDIYGKAAPLKRNEKMVDLADQILIIWDGISHGTKHTVSYAKKKNKNIVLLII